MPFGKLFFIWRRKVRRFFAFSRQALLFFDMIERPIEDGRQEGREETLMRINQLIIMLSKENRSEDIVKAAADREYQEQLLKEFNL